MGFNVPSTKGLPQSVSELADLMATKREAAAKTPADKPTQQAQPGDVLAMIKYLLRIEAQPISLPFIIVDREEVKRAQAPVDKIDTMGHTLLTLIRDAFVNPFDTVEVFLQGATPSVELTADLSISSQYPAAAAAPPATGPKNSAAVIAPFVNVDLSLALLQGQLAPVKLNLNGVTPGETNQLVITGGAAALVTNTKDFIADNIILQPQELVRLMHALFLPFQTVGNYEGTNRYVYSGLMMADGTAAGGYAAGPTEIQVDFPVGSLALGQNADCYAPGMIDDRFWDNVDSVLSAITLR